MSHPNFKEKNWTTIMGIFVLQDTAKLVKGKFGAIEAMAAEWELRCEADTNFPKFKQRASIYRWLKDGFPKSGNQIFGFCGLLDVDPMAILDYEANGYFSNFATLRRNIQLGLAHVGIIRPLYKVYKSGPDWPDDEVVGTCFDRPWFGQEFNNSEHWSEMNYCLVTASFKEKPNGNPRAVHIAYRRTDSSDTMWRFFGTVVSHEGELRLYSESGDYQFMPQNEPNHIGFRTFYGGRSVEFRTASLHEFSLDFDYPHNDKSTVGFEW